MLAQHVLSYNLIKVLRTGYKKERNNEMYKKRGITYYKNIEKNFSDIYIDIYKR